MSGSELPRTPGAGNMQRDLRAVPKAPHRFLLEPSMSLDISRGFIPIPQKNVIGRALSKLGKWML
jgi:hypothetical protein